MLAKCARSSVSWTDSSTRARWGPGGVGDQPEDDASTHGMPFCRWVVCGWRPHPMTTTTPHYLGGDGRVRPRPPAEVGVSGLGADSGHMWSCPRRCTGMSSDLCCTLLVDSRWRVTPLAYRYGRPVSGAPTDH